MNVIYYPFAGFTLVELKSIVLAGHGNPAIQAEIERQEASEIALDKAIAMVRYMREVVPGMR